MRLAESGLILSATDLASFLGCQHRSVLDQAAAMGKVKPPYRDDPLLEALRQRGLEHERRYADTLRAQGRTVVDLGSGPDAASRTRELLRAGTDVLLQAVLGDETWLGKPDVLLRVDSPSSLGPFSYEVADTKLSTETRAGTILQLALYSELLGELQGRPPEWFHVVTPDPDEPIQRYRLGDFAAYYRLVRDRLRNFVAEEPAGTYPEPVEHCDVCRWWSVCDARRRSDDHLSFVAGLTRLQRRELGEHGVNALAGLAGLPLPLPFRPRRGGVASLERAREQARLQDGSRGRTPPLYELLPALPGLGLAQLPAPSPGDLFLDLEGDPFARAGGREYLFGIAMASGNYRGRWAFTDSEERKAFEATVDDIVAALDADPSLHVYHFGAYEPAALKRLMGRHATREAEIDRLLRGRVLVDLHLVTRHALRAGVESYSLKALEALHGFGREVNLREAGVNKRILEHGLELGEMEGVAPGVREAVLGYNRDDCVSTRALRDWLEGRRAELEAGGTPVPRPAASEDEPPENVSEREARIGPIREALLASVPADPKERTPEQQARYLLAHLLDFYRREDKVSFWEKYRLAELSDDDLLLERDAIAGLELVGPVAGKGKLPTHRYRYPPQDTDFREGDDLLVRGGAKLGEVKAIDRGARTVDIKKRNDSKDLHPSAAFVFEHINTDVKADALERLARAVADSGMPPGAAGSLLLASPPQLRVLPFSALPGEASSDFAIRVAPHLDGTVLAIQGPPGAGKTYTGARMIAALVRAGQRVGVTAVSHKVIEKLLLEVRVAAPEIAIARKSGADEEPGPIELIEKNPDALARARAGTVVGGTAWLWSREEAASAVDVLFVDEAGQMSLADVLAISGATRSLVLLGDPQQLEQPLRGSHPEGSDASALEHILGGRATIPEDRGIFLSETRRLAPALCEFTSEVFYEDKLHSHGPLANQRLERTGRFEGAGLWLVPVEHEGNQSAAPEEVDAVKRLVGELLQPGSSWIDMDGASKPLTGEHVLVVAPYNAHVALLEEALAGTGVRIGTVDRFQGQQAPVVIYTMASSSPEDAPRGMEFLYSLNRLNVATSRAQCACLLVASPRLFGPECRTPRQMQLANALCRYVELAKQPKTLPR